MTTATHLECSLCAKRYEAGKIHNLCDCGGPLLVRYDLEKVRESWNREWIPNGPSSMWRYAPVLPVSKPAAIVSLGEGMTPLIHTARLGARLGSNDLWVKDEGVNPTGSFKARGLSCAISMCVELGVKKVAIPPPVTPPEPWPPTPPRPASKPTSSCRATSPNPTTSSAAPPAPTSLWSTA